MIPVGANRPHPGLSARSLLRVALLFFLVLLLLAGMAAGKAGSGGAQEAAGGVPRLTDAARGGVATAPDMTGPAADIAETLPGNPGTGAVASGGRKDLTMFFSIGAAVNILLMTVFAIWAVRQWRKTRDRN